MFLDGIPDSINIIQINISLNIYFDIFYRKSHLTCHHGCQDRKASSECTLKKVLDIIGGKWKILILCDLHQNGTLRYGTLKRSIIGITNAALSNSLKELQSDGLVIRTVHTEMPLQVEYSLSEKGSSIAPLLMDLSRWGENHLK